MKNCLEFKCFMSLGVSECDKLLIFQWFICRYCSLFNKQLIFIQKTFGRITCFFFWNLNIFMRFFCCESNCYFETVLCLLDSFLNSQRFQYNYWSTISSWLLKILILDWKCNVSYTKRLFLLLNSRCWLFKL